MRGERSELVRQIGRSKFVEPARRTGQQEFSIAVKSIQAPLLESGFPPNHVPQICNALRSGEFLRNNRLELVRTDGPPKLTSTTVVFHYRFQDAVGAAVRLATPAKDSLLGLRGSLRGAIREGAKAFLEELRSDRKESQ